MAPETARSFTVPLIANPHKAVGGHGNACAVDLNVGGVGQWALRGAVEKRSEQTFNQPAAGFATGAMGHFNLRFAEFDLASCGGHVVFVVQFS
ncbi:MAG: hypothetical protein ABSG69_11985 [Candidatus Acidiferrum sp.]